MNLNELSDAQLLGQLGVSTSTPEQFAQVYGPAAERAGKAIGVNPAALISQWGLETGWGKSVIPGTNNLGNIKDFTGTGVAATDNMTGSNDKYRAFESPEDFADHYAGLIQRKYKGAVGAGDDINKFTSALVSGGYAEDPAYAGKIQAIYAKQTQNPLMAMAGKIADAVIPAAHAEGVPQSDMSSMSDAQLMQALGMGAPKSNLPAGFMPLNQKNVHQPTDAELMAQIDQSKEDQFNKFLQSQFDPSGIHGVLAGEASGLAKVGLGAIHYAGKGLGLLGADNAGQSLVDTAASGRKYVEGLVKPYRDAAPFSTGAGELGSEIVATLPVGGVISKAVGVAAPLLGKAAPYAQKLAQAIKTGGGSTGSVPSGFWNTLGDVAVRSAGGAVTGGATAGLIDPESAGTGALIGGALPPVFKGAELAGKTVGAMVRPFYQGGQNNIVADTLRQFSANPQNARSQLQQAGEVIPGSMPTTAMAAGDDGLAALSRAMQNADPRFASELAARQTAQNQARTAAMEDIAGNTGKIDLAKQLRNDVTGPMREAVLSSAGKVPADNILSSIDRLISKPDNAGKLAQQGLNEFRGRIAQFSQDGAIDARSLYAIRRDINDVLGGKLQGEAGNLRHASGQLIGVKSIIDEAIDLASRRVPTPGTSVMNHGGNISRNAFPSPASSGPQPSWSEYLKTYTEKSIPINQMEKLDEVLKRAQTGSVDSQGAAILSAAKLNNLLKNDGIDLAKMLAPEQMDILRRLSADLNASQLASNSGRAVGSNTLQNIAQNNLLAQALGKTMGGSSVAQTTLGRLLQLPYGIANKQIQERLGNALLNPQEAARLLVDPKASALAKGLRGGEFIGYRVAPALSAR